MKKSIIITISLCFLVFGVFSVSGIVGHTANQVFPGIFDGNFTIDGLLNVTGNIVAAEPTANNHVATKSFVEANSGGGSPYINWSDCESKYSYEWGYDSSTLSCSSGYELVTFSCLRAYNEDTCRLSGTNSLYLSGNGNSNNDAVVGSIKCCKFVVP